MNVGELAQKLLDETKAELGSAWEDDLSVEARDKIMEATFDLADLTTQGLLGAKVDGEIAHVKAQIASWSFVGAALAQRAIKAAAENVVTMLGKFLRGAVGL